MSHLRVPDPGKEPATFIARALHDRLPDLISGAGTLYVWSPGAIRAMKKSGRAFDWVDGCARIPLLAGEVPNAQVKADAEREVRTVDGVRGINNNLQVKNPPSP